MSEKISFTFNGEVFTCERGQSVEGDVADAHVTAAVDFSPVEIHSAAIIALLKAQGARNIIAAGQDTAAPDFGRGNKTPQ